MVKEQYAEIKLKNKRQMVRVMKNLIKSAITLYDAGLIELKDYKAITDKIGTYIVEKVMKFDIKLKKQEGRSLKNSNKTPVKGLQGIGKG